MPFSNHEVRHENGHENGHENRCLSMRRIIALSSSWLVMFTQFTPNVPGWK